MEQKKSFGAEEDDENDNAVEGEKKKFLGPSENGVALDLNLPASSKYIDLFANDKTLECTNYSLWFKAIIDHIFVSNGNDSSSETNSCYFAGNKCDQVVKQLLPAPSMDELSEHIAIPSHM